MLLFNTKSNRRFASTDKNVRQHPVARHTTSCGLERLEDRRLFATVPVAGAVPLLSSNPSATAKLYLDFDGDAATTWNGVNIPATPAYSSDGDTATFTDIEVQAIREIWTRVAEKFSPFNLDVTTINPGNFANKVGLKAVIGGDGAWRGISTLGVATMGSFYDSTPNSIYIFPGNIGGGYAPYVAETVAHYAGHSFGLQFQAVYDQDGWLVNSRNPGNTQLAPVMGQSWYAGRGVWWQGSTVIADYDPVTNKFVPRVQDDMAVIAGANNGFGYRPDDRGNTIAAASAISSGVAVAGIIGTATDVDYFSFTTSGGAVTINGNVAQQGAMLNLKLQVFNASGTLVASSDSANLSEALSTNLASGTYYVAVSGHGMVACLDSNGVNQGSGYDVGQYTLTVNAAGGGTSTPTVPTGLTATGMNTGVIQLNWTDTSSNETGFTIQRSTNGGTSWSNIDTVGTNVKTFSEPPVVVGAVKYRVLATNAAGSSGYSNIATFNVIPADANLDGVLDGDDYFAIDSNVLNTTAHGWSKGDFNFDGVINGDDYWVLDSHVLMY